MIDATVAIVGVMIADDPSWDNLFTARADCSIPSNGSTLTTRVTNFVYDFDGHLTQVNSPEGVINYDYDLATGRLTSTCTTNSYLAYTYDALARLKTVTISKRNGSGITPETTTYKYDAVGNRSEVDLPNGVVTAYLYDSLNRLTNMTHQFGITNLATYRYLLDATGRRTNAVEILRQEDNTYLTNTMVWQFDGMYRLTNEISVSTSLSPTYAYTNSYQYDLAGNRLRKIRTGGGAETINYGYDANDELLHETNATTVTTYLYDANGSLTNQATGTTNYSYSYNLMNKLSSVTGPGGTTSFQYNDQGIRVRTMGASTKYYLVDANNHTGYQQVLEELNAPGGTPTMSYVLGDDVLAQASGSSASYLLCDGHGNTRQMMGSTGITSRYNYDAYGVMQTTTSSSSAEAAADAGNSHLYSGEQYESALQMYNLRARYYNPANGRFNQRDSTIGNGEDPQSLHKYLYTYCDPVNAGDPSGNDVIQLIVVGAIIGAIMGGVIGGILSGWRGAVKGIITGALVGPLFALGIAGAGAALAGILWAVFGSMVISSQLATFIVAALVTAKGISNVSNELDKIDLSKPTADREILACQVELVSMFLLQALSAIPLGKSGKMSLSEGREVRANYDAGAEEIADTADSMERQGKPLKEIAKALSDMRRANRIAARQKMSSWLDVQMLEARDFAKYGDPDGPSFEWKISQAQSKGLTGDAVWKYIISSASRTDQATSEQFK